MKLAKIAKKLKISQPFNGSSWFDFLAITALFLALSLCFWVDGANQDLTGYLSDGGVGDILFLSLLLISGWFAHKKDVKKSMIIFWRVVLSSLLILLGLRVLGLFPMFYLGDIMGEVVARIFYFTFYLLFVILLELHPEESGEALAQHRIWGYWLGGPLLVCGLFGYLVVLPAYYAPEYYESWQPSMLFFVVLDTYIIWRLGLRIIHTPSSYWKGVYFWLLQSFVIWFGNDLTETLYNSQRLSEALMFRLEPTWWLPYFPLTFAINRKYEEFADIPLVKPPKSTPWQQLLLVTAIIPIVHVLGYFFEFLNPLVESQRLSLVIVWLVVLSILAWWQFNQLVMDAGRHQPLPNNAYTVINQQHQAVIKQLDELLPQVSASLKPPDQTRQSKPIEQLERKDTEEPVKEDVKIDTNDEFKQKVNSLLLKKGSEADFDLKAFAKAMALSERQLQRKCVSIFSENPSRIIRGYRLQLAKRKLRNNEVISLICHEVGYTSLSYFGKCFKEDFGMSPRDYQKAFIASKPHNKEEFE